MLHSEFSDLFDPFEARHFCFASVSIPSAIMYAGLAASAASAAVGAVGAVKAGQAEAAAAETNANIAKANTQIANQNATWATQAGEQQAAQSEQKTRATIGALKANEAASGLDVNSGSAVDVRSSAAELGELDAITIRSNAARQAYGYESQAATFTTEGQLDTMQAQNATTAADFNAATTFLGGMGNAANNWANWQLNSRGIGGNNNGSW